MRTRRTICTVAALAALTTGCGGAASTGADAVAWTNGVCSALAGFTRAATAGPGAAPPDPVAAVRGVGRYHGSTTQELDRSLAALEAVGPSPVDGGDQYVTRLREALGSIRVGYETARTQLAAIDTADPAALATAAPAAMAPLRELQDMPDPTEELRDNEQLRGASEQAPHCRELRTTAPPTG